MIEETHEFSDRVYASECIKFTLKLFKNSFQNFLSKVGTCHIVLGECCPNDTTLSGTIGITLGLSFDLVNDGWVD